MHLLLENFSNETILILESSVNRGQDNGEPIVEEGETMIISSLSVLESKSWFLSSTACYSQNTIQNIEIFYRLDTSYRVFFLTVPLHSVLKWKIYSANEELF